MVHSSDIGVRSQCVRRWYHAYHAAKARLKPVVFRMADGYDYAHDNYNTPGKMRVFAVRRSTNTLMGVVRYDTTTGGMRCWRNVYLSATK